MRRDALVVEATPDPRDVRTLEDRLYEYNVARTGCADGQLLAIFLREEDGAVCGGLYGWTWSGWLEVRSLWVHERLRGLGHGTRLLTAAEDEGRARGCHTAILETHSFQAPDFYEHRGYRVHAVLEGYPTGHRKLFMRKDLRDGDGEVARGVSTPSC
jgi:GNAT superfamily N-acetyltransferase